MADIGEGSVLQKRVGPPSLEDEIELSLPGRPDRRDEDDGREDAQRHARDQHRDRLHPGELQVDEENDGEGADEGDRFGGECHLVRLEVKSHRPDELSDHGQADRGDGNVEQELHGTDRLPNSDHGNWRLQP